MRRLGPALLAGAIVLTGLLGATAPASATAGAGATPGAAAGSVQVGSQTLTRCHVEGAPAWCGALAVPLDRSDPTAGTISIGFG